MFPWYVFSVLYCLFKTLKVYSLMADQSPLVLWVLLYQLKIAVRQYVSKAWCYFYNISDRIELLLVPPSILYENNPLWRLSNTQHNSGISQVEGRFHLFVVIKIMDGNPTIFIENVLTYYSGFWRLIYHLQLRLNLKVTVIVFLQAQWWC